MADAFVCPPVRVWTSFGTAILYSAWISIVFFAAAGSAREAEGCKGPKPAPLQRVVAAGGVRHPFRPHLTPFRTVSPEF